MQFFVHGVDEEGVEEQLEDLGEAHWTYMDRFAEQLVARGPTLSADGEAHTGSVHVIEAPDLAAAWRFALDEPYARAGLYRSVDVTRWWNALGGTMWDRLPASRDVASTLVIARWPRLACEPDARVEAWGASTRPFAPDAFVFGGLLLDDGGRSTVGLVLALDMALADAERLAHGLGGPSATSIVTRWSRGGRPAD